MALIQVATWPETFSLVWLTHSRVLTSGFVIFAGAMGCPFWNDLLFDKEIQSSSGANLRNTLQGRPNLLVGEVTHSHADVWKAIEFVPPGCSGESIAKDFLTWDECMPLSEITLLWNAKGIKPRHRGFFWCLAARSSDFGESFDYEIDNEATVIPIESNREDCVHMLSFFGGGFGGWTYGMKHLSAYHGVKAQIVAIESDLTACATYAANHDVPVINGYVSLPVDVLSHMSQGCVIHGSVLSNNWIAAAAKWHPHVLTISPPCQPWSNAGRGKGLDSSEGLCFPEALLQARFLQPQCIGLEQVTGFNTHEHRALVMKTISMIGYAVVWSRSNDFGIFGPVARSRWLAVLQKVSEIPPVDWIPQSVCEQHEKSENTPEALRYLSTVTSDNVQKISQPMHPTSCLPRDNNATATPQPFLHPFQPVGKPESPVNDPSGMMSDTCTDLKAERSPEQKMIPNDIRSLDNANRNTSFDPDNHLQPFLHPLHPTTEKPFSSDAIGLNANITAVTSHAQATAPNASGQTKVAHNPTCSSVCHCLSVPEEGSPAGVMPQNQDPKYQHVLPSGKVAVHPHVPEACPHLVHPLHSSIEQCAGHDQLNTFVHSPAKTIHTTFDTHCVRDASEENIRSHSEQQALCQEVNRSNNIFLVCHCDDFSPNKSNIIPPRIDISPPQPTLSNTGFKRDIRLDHFHDQHDDSHDPEHLTGTSMPCHGHKVKHHCQTHDADTAVTFGPQIEDHRPLRTHESVQPGASEKGTKRKSQVTPRPDLVQIPSEAVKQHTPKSFKAIFPPTDNMDSQLRISKDMMQIVQSHEFLPPAKKRKLADKTPLQLRTYQHDEKLPVIMAAYGSQHKLNADMLRSKGCLAHFIQDDQEGPRLLHPAEIAMIHAWCYSQILCNPPFPRCMANIGQPNHPNSCYDGSSGCHEFDARWTNHLHARCFQHMGITPTENDQCHPEQRQGGACPQAHGV